MAVSFATVAGLAFGYDLGVVGGAELYMQEELSLSDGALSSIVAAAKVGAVLGVLVGVVMFDIHGRRLAFALSGVFYLVGPILLSISQGAGLLFVGRLLVGIGVGMSSVVSTAYLGEISPSRYRGRIIECSELALASGNLLALFVDYLLDGAWRWMLGAPAILGAVIICSFAVLPESPRWLVTQGKVDEALVVIRRLVGENVASGVRASPRADAELLQLWSATEKERVRRNSESNLVARTSKLGTFFKERAYELRQLATGAESPQFRLVLLLAIVNQMSASTSVINYGPRIMQSAGVNERSTDTLLTSLTAFAKLIGIIVSIGLIDRIGRRKLLMWGSASCALSMAGIALLPSSASVAACMCIFMFSFAASHAGVFGVLVGESFSMHYKQVAFAASGVALYLSGAIADACLLGLLNVGRSSFLLFAFIMIAGWILVKGELPETKGLELSDVRAVYASGVSRGRRLKTCGFACAHWKSDRALDRSSHVAIVSEDQDGEGVHLEGAPNDQRALLQMVDVRMDALEGEQEADQDDLTLAVL